MMPVDLLTSVGLAISGFVIGFVGGMVGLVLGAVRFPVVMSIETSTASHRYIWIFIYWNI
jgi:hypothetical protein